MAVFDGTRNLCLGRVDNNNLFASVPQIGNHTLPGPAVAANHVVTAHTGNMSVHASLSNHSAKLA